MHICEQYLDNCKKLLVTFMDLEKNCDRMNRRDFKQKLEIFGIGGRLLRSVKSEALVRIHRREGDHFPVKVGF